VLLVEINVMIIRMYPTAPRRGSKLSAHGIAMGIWSGAVRPEGAKALKALVLFVLLPLQGVRGVSSYPWRCHGLLARCPFGAQAPDCG